MNIHLQSLLAEMSDERYRLGEWSDEGVYDSEKTISWLAHQKASLLTETSYLPELYNLVSTSELVEEREHAYFIIGCIARNTNNEPATEFLLDRLKVEKLTSTLCLILDRLEELYKPAHLDISIIYELISKKGALVRHAAFMALTDSEHGIEDKLLDLLQRETDGEDIVWLFHALGYVGTERAIPILEAYLKHRKLDVRETVKDELVTIMVRAGRSIPEICGLTGFSTQIVQSRKEKIGDLTRPG